MTQLIVRLKGIIGPSSNRIYVNGKEIKPALSQRLHNHSPDGFSWGYHGSGPAQTALGICLEVLKDPDAAFEVYQIFKHEYVAKWRCDDDFEVEVNFTEFMARHYPDHSLPDQPDTEGPASPDKA